LTGITRRRKKALISFWQLGVFAADYLGNAKSSGQFFGE
jgi:hypothetical protein